MLQKHFMSLATLMMLST